MKIKALRIVFASVLISANGAEADVKEDESICSHEVGGITDCLTLTEASRITLNGKA